jgi:hypothetical protein
LIFLDSILFSLIIFIFFDYIHLLVRGESKAGWRSFSYGAFAGENEVRQQLSNGRDSATGRGQGKTQEVEVVRPDSEDVFAPDASWRELSRDVGG